MNLLEIKNGKHVFNAIWTYNLCGKEINKITWDKAETLLNILLDDIINQKDTITEQQAKDIFAKAVYSLEMLLETSPLDDFGVYEYGGLNYFFADIMISLGFPVKQGKNALISNFVYGIDFKET